MNGLCRRTSPRPGTTARRSTTTAAAICSAPQRKPRNHRRWRPRLGSVHRLDLSIKMQDLDLQLRLLGTTKGETRKLVLLSRCLRSGLPRPRLRRHRGRSIEVSRESSQRQTGAKKGVPHDVTLVRARRATRPLGATGRRPAVAAPGPPSGVETAVAIVMHKPWRQPRLHGWLSGIEAAAEVLGRTAWRLPWVLAWIVPPTRVDTVMASTRY